MGLTSGETSHSLTLLEAARFRYPAVPSVDDSGRSRMSSEEYQDNEPETSKRPSQKPLRLEEVCRRIGAGGRQRHCRKIKVERRYKKGKKGEKRAVFEETKKATRGSQNDVPDLFLLASAVTKARVGGINSFACGRASTMAFESP